MFGDQRQREGELQHEIAVARHVEAVGRHGVEAQSPGHVLAVDRQARAGHGRGPQSEHVGVRAASGQPRPVALQFFAVGQPIVGGQHRLGTLQVRVGGQNAALVLVGPSHEGPLQGDHPRVDPVDGLADPQPQVGRNLVVAAAGGVQLAADVAQAIDQCPLDVHVDVFQLDAEREAALLNFLADFAERLLNLLAFVDSEQADFGQHLGMGDRAGDVLRIKPAIEAHAFGELLDAAVGRLLENASPSLLSHLVSSTRASRRPPRPTH